MAFFMPFTSDPLFNAQSLVDAPVVQDPMSAWFDFDAYSQDSLMQSHSYELQAFDLTDNYSTGPFPHTYSLDDDYSIGGTVDATSLGQEGISPSVLTTQPLDTWFASQVDDTPDSSNTIEHVRSSAPSPVDFSSVELYRYPRVPPSPIPRPSAPRPYKRKIEDSDYDDAEDDDTSSSCSEYAPRRPAKRSFCGLFAKKAPKAPLPASLQPIKVRSATLPRCPMPGCGIALEDRDSVWRGHFKRAHHDDLCMTPGCRGLVAGSCKARCPFPLDGCKSCHGHEEKGRKAGADAGAMTIESVGRHLLNIHFKVAYRCPLCGLQNEWRESACVRHIRRCSEKHGKPAKKRSIL